MRLSIELFLLFLLTTLIASEPDPNFYIYLSFGQTIMEGSASIEEEDLDEITERFQMMPVVNMPTKNRVIGEWYPAYPPLSREYSGMSTLDFFGRSLVKNLPENIKVGVVNVAFGASIAAFDEDKVEEYLNSTAPQNIKFTAENFFGNHPYKVLIDTAKKAQKNGVIKGILYGKDEFNDIGDKKLPEKLKIIYERMLEDLNLKNEEVPLLVGTLVKDENGLSSSKNVIANVSSVISNSFAISAVGIRKEGFKLLGTKMAEAYINYLGLKFYNQDPNFYIYLAFGQSIFEGGAKIEQEDLDDITERFKMMPVLDMPVKKRVAGEWYQAFPPLSRDYYGISPLDFFGRNLIKNLPENITVGIVDVAIGASIDIFDEDVVESYLNNSAPEYIKGQASSFFGNNPYKALIDNAKKAQKYGVIKGILYGKDHLTDSRILNWPDKLELIYERILADLNLKTKNVPLLVGSIIKNEDMFATDKNAMDRISSLILNSYTTLMVGERSKENLKLLGKKFAEDYLNYLGLEYHDPDPDEPDPNFYIFLAFGESNMEGQGYIEKQDRMDISDRFKMMPAISFSNGNRKAGEWYKANPPLCRDQTRLSPLDYFGRTLIEKLQETKKVGVINVSVEEASIVLFDEDRSTSYLQTADDWIQDIVSVYNNNPFRVLVNSAKKAQKSGIIKGILLHQGESDSGDKNWPKNVKIIYDKLLEELNLKEEDVPLLVGELVSKEEGGLFYEHNQIINTINKEITNSLVISSESCPSQNDGYHFNSEGYRMMGKRYGEAMYEYLKDHNGI